MITPQSGQTHSNSVFDYFVRLALKGTIKLCNMDLSMIVTRYFSKRKAISSKLLVWVVSAKLVYYSQISFENILTTCLVVSSSVPLSLQVNNLECTEGQSLQFVTFNPWKVSRNLKVFDERRHWRTCKRGLFVKSYCFFKTIA